MSILSFNNFILGRGDSVLNYDSTPEPLPPYTIRLKFKEGVTPTFSKGTGVLVDSENNIWDLTYENSDWANLLNGHTDLLEVLSANSTGVTKMSYMFYNCTSLTTVPLFDTNKVTEMKSMFQDCTLLTTVPLFDTSNVSNMYQMFSSCFNVQSGALALYQQASSQDIPPTNHIQTFHNCGSFTTTGAAELAQIPNDWK